MNDISFHYFILKLKSPNKAEQINLSNKKTDVLEAEDHFNQHFKDLKSLVVLDVREATLFLLLVLHQPLRSKVTAKEITFFSRILYRERGWDDFSNEDGKLFIPTVPIKELNHYEADHALDEFDVDRSRYSWFPDVADETDNTTAEELEESHEEEGLEELSDEKIVAILQFVLATQGMGPIQKQQEKRKAIIKIKAVLNQFIYN